MNQQQNFPSIEKFCKSVCYHNEISALFFQLQQIPPTFKSSTRNSIITEYPIADILIKS